MCSELYELVVTLINKTQKFSPLLEAIESTVGSLDSLLPQIEELNEKLKISNKETDRLKKTLSDGQKLVGECSNDPKRYKKAKYTDKLTVLDESLKRELGMLTAHVARDTRDTLLLARKHDKQLVESERDGKETLDKVKEINKLFMIIIIVLCRPRERRRIATAVPDGIILSRCKVRKPVVELAKLGISLVWIFVQLLAFFSLCVLHILPR